MSKEREIQDADPKPNPEREPIHLSLSREGLLYQGPLGGLSRVLLFVFGMALLYFAVQVFG